MIACRYVFALSTTCDIGLAVGLGYGNLHEMVFDQTEPVSDLVWENKPLFTLGAQVFLKTPVGFTFFTNAYYVPASLSMRLTDTDYKNKKIISFSQHGASTCHSLIADLGIGWNFFVPYLAAERENSFSIEPRLMAKFLLLNFGGFSGTGYKATNGIVTSKQVFIGKQIDYGLRLFSLQGGLQFHFAYKQLLEFAGGFAFGIYTRAVAYDFHIIRQLKYYDLFNFYIFTGGVNFELSYLLSDVGLKTAVSVDAAYSNLGCNVTHDISADYVTQRDRGSTGIQYLSVRCDIGVFFRIGKRK